MDPKPARRRAGETWKNAFSLCAISGFFTCPASKGKDLKGLGFARDIPECILRQQPEINLSAPPRRPIVPPHLPTNLTGGSVPLARVRQGTSEVPQVRRPIP